MRRPNRLLRIGTIGSTRDTSGKSSKNGSDRSDFPGQHTLMVILPGWSSCLDGHPVLIVILCAAKDLAAPYTRIVLFRGLDCHPERSEGSRSPLHSYCALQRLG